MERKSLQKQFFRDFLCISPKRIFIEKYDQKIYILRSHGDFSITYAFYSKINPGIFGIVLRIDVRYPFFEKSHL